MSENNHIQNIWKNFQSGDKEAFAWIYNLYVDVLFRYGNKLCQDEGFVKDSIQEVFLDLYLKRYKNKTNPENLKFYLILALKRNLIKKLKWNRMMVDEDSTNDHFFEPGYNIENTIIEQEENEEINRRVSKALIQLPSKQKEIIYLRFNESLEYSEIARLLNISIESGRKQVYRALKKIRESFGNETFIFWLLSSKKNNY